jgi:hypothetical protein
MAWNRIARSADDLGAAIRGRPEASLHRRPDANKWAAVEIVCHLRDAEELFLLRLETIAAVDEPLLPAAGMGPYALRLEREGQPAAPDRWATDRQYLRNDTGEALASFRRWRRETIDHLAALSPAQWQRAGIHSRRGRLTVGDIVAEMARHDDAHIDQLSRALAGPPSA